MQPAVAVLWAHLPLPSYLVPLLVSLCSHVLIHFKSHMDPFSITVGCLALATAASKVSSSILSFIKSYRAARSELFVFKKQFDELSMILGVLKDDEGPNTPTSHLASEKTQEQINICMDVIDVLNNKLDGHQASTCMGRARWVVTGKSQVEELNQKLAAAIDHFKLCLGAYEWQVT